MKNVLDIFTTVAKEENLKIGSLEKAIGASKGVLSRAINNETDVQSKWFLALVEKFPQYDYNKMLKGEFSTDSPGEDSQQVSEPAGAYSNLLQEVHADLKKDLHELSAGMERNLYNISQGVYQGLRDQQKILRFVEGLDAGKIARASEGLEEFLKTRK